MSEDSHLLLEQRNEVEMVRPSHSKKIDSLEVRLKIKV